MPARHLRSRERDRVAHQPHRRTRREHELLLRLVLLQDVVLQRAPEAGTVDANLFCLSNEHRHDHRGRRVDRHRCRDRAEVDTGIQILHVGQRIDRHTAPADFTERHRVIGIDPQQRRHVERRRQAVAARLDDLLEPPIGVVGGAESGKHPHRPHLRPVHRCIRSSGVRELAGVLTRPIRRAVCGSDRDARHRRIIHVTHGRLGQGLLPQLTVGRHAPSLFGSQSTCHRASRLLGASAAARASLAETTLGGRSATHHHRATRPAWRKGASWQH